MTNIKIHLCSPDGIEEIEPTQELLKANIIKRSGKSFVLDHFVQGVASYHEARVVDLDDPTRNQFRVQS